MAKNKFVYDMRCKDIIPYREHHKGTVGIELELEGERFVQCPGWVNKQENSLRGGTEYVLAAPKSPEGAAAALNDAKVAMEYGGTVLYPSSRTSTHLHLNVQNETPRTIAYTTGLYVLMEPYVLSTLPGTRSGNLFCLSAKDTGDLPEFMEDFVLSCQSPFFHGWGDRGKYASLNLKPITDFGSIEFRVFPEAIKNNKLDVHQINTWISFCLALLKNGRELALAQDLIDFVNMARTDPNWALRKFPALGGDPELITMAAEDAYEVAYAIKRGETGEGMLREDEDKDFIEGDDDDMPEVEAP